MEELEKYYERMADFEKGMQDFWGEKDLPKERKILVSQIECPDGTMLVSRHRHDYVTHTCTKTGLEFMLDGGNDYRRYRAHDDYPFYSINRSIYSDDNFELIRQHYCRGGRGKNGDEPLTWVPLCEMSNNWLEAVLTYNVVRSLDATEANRLYQAELDYRTENGIVIND